MAAVMYRHNGGDCKRGRERTPVREARPAVNELTLHFSRALTPQGWRDDVRLTIADGSISRRRNRRRAAIRRRALAPSARRASAICTATPSSARWPGSAERRGAGADSFWTWRETMYRFALDDRRPTTSRRSPPSLCRDAGGGLHARSASSTICTTRPTARPMQNRRNGRRASSRRRPTTGTRPDAASGLLCPSRLRRRAAQRGAASLPHRPRRLREPASTVARGRALARRRRVGIAPHSLRAATPPGSAALVSARRRGPIHIHAAEQVKEVEACLAWSGARPVEWLLDHARRRRALVPRPRHPYDRSETRRLARSRRGRRPLPDHRGQSRRRRLSTRRGIFSERGRFGVGSDSNVEIGARRRAASSSNMRSGCATAPATSARFPRGSTGRALYERALAGGARALGRQSGALRPGAAADLVSLRADHPTLAGRSGDAILDAWIFAVGNPLVDCVWSGGRKVVADGRHLGREPIAARYAAAMRRLAQ